MKSFRTRMKSKGATSRDRIMLLKSRSFEQWFNTTLNKYLVTIDDVEQEAVIQDHNQNNNNDLSDDKYVIVRNDSDISVGSYMDWDNECWLVFSDEHKTIKTHKQSKIKETNDTINWMINGELCNDGKGYRSHVKNQTLYTLGVSTSGNNLWVANSKMMIYLPSNDEVDSLKLGDRMFIGNNVYQIMFNDNVSRKGLSNFLLEQDFYNPNRDNLELRIADYYRQTDEESDAPDPKPDELVINGPSRVKVGSTATYTVKVDNDESVGGINEWSILDLENATQVIDRHPDSLTIRVENNFSKVGSSITIVGRTIEGVTGSKVVNIVSPY